MQPWHIRRVRVIADLLWLRGFHMQCFVVLRDCVTRKLQGHSKIVKIQSDISLPPDIFPTFSFRKLFSWHGPFNWKFRAFKFIVEVSVKMYAFLASSFISFLKPYSKIYNVKKTRIGHTGIPKHCNSQWCPFKCHVRLGKICAINTYFISTTPL